MSFLVTSQFAKIIKLYNTTLEDFKKKVETSSALSLTTNGWTWINNRSYVTITAHFIDGEGKMSWL